VKTSHRIRVLGREISVRSNASAESVQEVESFVNRKLAEVAVSIPSADQQLVTLLSLLNITESYLALRRADGSSGLYRQEAVDRMVDKIDNALE